MRISEKKLTGRSQSIMALVAKKRRQMASLVMALVVMAGVGGGIVLFKKVPNTTPPTATATPTTSATAVTVDPKFSTVQAFIAGAKEAGWSQDQLAVEFVDESADNSTAGTRSFLATGAKTTSELLSWLGGDSRSADGTRLLITEYTGATNDEIYNQDYWVVAQAKGSFQYTEITLWRNGSIHTQSGRAGNAGDIFFAFVPPRNESKIVYVRGGCANPTLNIPIPKEPTPTTRPTTTQPPVDEPEPTTTKPARPGEPTTRPTTTKPATTLKAKDPSKDILANPLVADWKKNGQELLEVLWDLDAPNGYQPDPRGSAEEKAEAINKTNKELEETHQAVVTQAPVVDDNQGHVAVTKPNDDPTWSPFG